MVTVDEKAGVVFYTARSGDNHMKVQLHRVRLDGTNDVRLTDPAFHHTVTLSPTGQHFVDVAQAHDVPPTTRLIDGKGKMVAELATSDASKFDQLGLKRVVYGSDLTDPRQNWAEVLRLIPLTRDEFGIIASNVAPYLTGSRK